MSHKIVYSDLQVKDIIGKYLNEKKTIKDIASLYGISDIVIKRVLRENSIQTRLPEETSRKYYFNEHYFDFVDSPEKAYFLGLLMADGYNSNASIALVLSKKDEEIIKRFKKAVDSNKFIKSYEFDGREYSSFCLYSKYFAGKLTELGCMSGKTFKLQFPDYLNNDLIRHFIRGYFDGDGCISYHFTKKSNYFGNSFASIINFTSTYDFCLCLQKYFLTNFNINTYMSCRNPKNNNNNRTVTISGNQHVIKVAKWMYDGTDLYLSRKHQKFLDIQKILGERGVIVKELRSENGRKVMLNVNASR